METFFDEIKRYVRFAGEDVTRLVAFAPIAEPHFQAITETFYSRLLEHDHARKVLNGDKQVERLKVSLRAWLRRCLAGPWDEAYFEQSSRIGRRHVQVGLPQRYMFTAMGVIREALLEIAHESLESHAEVGALCSSLNKVIDLELAIMLKTYGDDSMEALRRVERFERDLLEKRLHISEERYHAIVETAEVLVIAVDSQRRVILFNRTAENVTGYRRSEVVGTDAFESMWHPADAEELRNLVSRALAGERLVPQVARIVARRGDERWIRWQVTTLASATDPIVCAIGIDLTEERSLEDQSRRAERLAALGTLAAGLAHEIRNPLNAAQLQLLLVERRLAKHAERDEAAQTAAIVVREELSRLAGLVEDFLAFARPAPLRYASVDLAPTIESVVALLAPAFEEHGVTARLAVTAGIVARCDEEKVKQVIHNLARNAIEAAGRGGSVEIRLHREVSNAVLEVVDSGVGPPPGLAMWEPFHTSKVGGTGLGLSIVHRIVVDHGGSVTCGRANEKTVFRVVLPVDGI